MYGFMISDHDYLENHTRGFIYSDFVDSSVLRALQNS